MSERIFIEIDAAFRRRIEDVIERLIDVCDEIDGLVEDREPQGDDEPPETPVHSRGANGSAPISRIY